MRTFSTLIMLGFFAVTQIGCSTTKALNKKTDYELTYTHLKQQSYNAARISYPKKETNGFITLTEKSWLGLLSDQPTSLKEIEKMGNQLPQKEMTVLSEEASHFFYQKTAEGYFPAEHEVIVFHLISAMSLLKQDMLEAARVEAKKAAFYLQEDYISHVGAFDDPYLRVWSASIWMALGEWNSAQVDLRRAAELSRDYSWAKELSAKDRPPKRWTVVFQGTGPELEWDPSGFHQHWTGRGSLQFIFPQHLNVEIKTGEQAVQPLTMESSSAMYERHQLRNARIREALETSDYMMKSSSMHIGAGAAKGLGKMANATFKAIGLALGGAIIIGTLYVIMEAGGSEGTGELAALGFGLGLGSFQTFSDAGSDIDTSVTKSVDKSLDEALDISKTYRFVRFIPDTIHLATSNGLEGETRVDSEDSDEPVTPFLKVSTKSSVVEFLFVPL